MNKDQILAIIRHTITFVGGILVIRGTIEESTVQEIAGAAISLISTIWSVIIKKQ